ncbi:MAG: PadR family transcriptional regulator [Candidatus Nanoarchaeia archaeon]
MKEVPEVLDLRGFLSFQILHELKHGNKCGDELAESIGGKKGRKLTPGTIYPALKKLKKHQLIASTKKDGRKKVYELTRKGEKEYLITKRIVKNMFKGI